MELDVGSIFSLVLTADTLYNGRADLGAVITSLNPAGTIDCASQ